MENKLIFTYENTHKTMLQIIKTSKSLDFCFFLNLSNLSMYKTFIKFR